MADGSRLRPGDRRGAAVIVSCSSRYRRGEAPRVLDIAYDFVAFALVPPVGLLIPSIFALAVTRRYPRAATLILAIFLFGLTGLAMPVVSGSLMGSLESDLPMEPSAGDPPQVIVLLGGDFSRDASSANSFEVGPLSLERERAAAILERRTGLPVLVTGGPVVSGREAIGTLMDQSLTSDFGIRARWVETRARDTWENAQFSAAILMPRGITAVYLVTQAWHMRRAVQAFRHFGMHPLAAPTNIQPRLEVSASAFVPRAKSWLDSYYALHEWFGYAFYSIRDR
jgi:uncharacterized SAM-binding protein YcdF (DUF218 family)